MTKIPELISVRDAFLKIEESVDSALPRMPVFSSIHQFINSSIHQFINSSIHQFLAAESVERPDSIGVEDERFPIGFVWQQSVDIAWAVCASVNEMYVALPCGLYEQVLTKEFGNPLNSGGLSNKYFDLISRRTITEFFAVKALGSGLR